MARIKVEISYEHEVDDKEVALMKSLGTFGTYILELKEELEDEFNDELNAKIFVNEMY